MPASTWRDVFPRLSSHVVAARETQPRWFRGCSWFASPACKWDLDRDESRETTEQVWSVVDLKGRTFTSLQLLLFLGVFLIIRPTAVRSNLLVLPPLLLLTKLPSHFNVFHRHGVQRREENAFIYLKWWKFTATNTFIYINIFQYNSIINVLTGLD